MVSYLSWMIPSSKIWAKIGKGLLCGMLFMWAVPGMRAQTGRAVYDSSGKEVILIHGQDTIAYIPFDKTFKAQLNHEKNRKSKTVYYRLATYTNPAGVSPVPIVITNAATIHLQGMLHGDTTARFDCQITLGDKNVSLQMETKDIATNQFSFCIRLAHPQKWAMQDMKSPYPMYSKKKKNLMHITVRGNRPVFSFAINRRQGAGT